MVHDPHAALAEAEPRLAARKHARETELRRLARGPGLWVVALAFVVPFGLAGASQHALRKAADRAAVATKEANTRTADKLSAKFAACRAEVDGLTASIETCRHDESTLWSGRVPCGCEPGDPLCACP